MNNYNNSNMGQGFDNFNVNNQGDNSFNGYQNNYGYMNTQENMQIQNNDFDVATISEYKQRLRGMKEVQDLTSEVEIQNPNSIVMFGQGASEQISKVSDELLNSMKAVKAEEASEMLVNLTKIMDKFDIKELDGSEKQSMLSKFMKGVGNSVAKLFQKYDTMGYEVEKVYVLLKKYENDIREPKAQALVQIADALKVSTDYLLGLTDEMEIQNNSLADKSDEEFEAIYEAAKEKFTTGTVMFDGEPATQEAIDSMLQAMRMGMLLALEEQKKKRDKK